MLLRANYLFLPFSVAQTRRAAPRWWTAGLLLLSACAKEADLLMHPVRPARPPARNRCPSGEEGVLLPQWAAKG